MIWLSAGAIRLSTAASVMWTPSLSRATMPSTVEAYCPPGSSTVKRSSMETYGIGRGHRLHNLVVEVDDVVRCPVGEVGRGREDHRPAVGVGDLHGLLEVGEDEGVVVGVGQRLVAAVEETVLALPVARLDHRHVGVVARDRPLFLLGPQRAGGRVVVGRRLAPRDGECPVGVATPRLRPVLDAVGWEGLGHVVALEPGQRIAGEVDPEPALVGRLRTEHVVDDRHLRRDLRGDLRWVERWVFGRVARCPRTARRRR